MYAILDIESTGGKYNEEGITEIAIYRFDGNRVIDQFISLVNPEKPIQDYVVKLTGISNKMLRNAPKFHEIAKRVVEITNDCILVAHNAEFDNRILTTEFERLGFPFQKDSLCTVELSRQLIPDQNSYSLGKLCRALGIPMSDRHRANGDALATVELFKLLLEKDTDKSILQSSIKYSDNRTQKEKLNNILEETPEIMGIFYIYNEDGKIIFIGKGKNIKAELNKLFLKVSKRAERIKDRLYKITYEATGNELFTRLKHQLELDTVRPKYNFVRRKKRNPEDFAHDDFLLVLEGRIPEENGNVLVLDNEVIGYGFTNLAYQEINLDILKPKLTEIKNKNLAKAIVKNYLKSTRGNKIVRF